jgi:hypothetical protein
MARLNIASIQDLSTTLFKILEVFYSISTFYIKMSFPQVGGKQFGKLFFPLGKYVANAFSLGHPSHFYDSALLVAVCFHSFIHPFIHSLLTSRNQFTTLHSENTAVTKSRN